MKESNRSIFALQWRIVLAFWLAIGLIVTAHTPALARRRHRRTPPVAHKYGRIRSILIDTTNVFDPQVKGENHFPFTWANAIHFTTHQKVIRRELLFKPGDMADPNVLAESERLLRSLPFIKAARISTLPAPNGQVDVVVHTQDSWTTQAQIDFGTSGERNHFDAGILEENLLGLGKTVSYFYRTNPDGVTREYGYADPQVLGSRVQFSSLVDSTPTGNQEHVTVAHPFYSLQTRYAGGSTWNHIDEEQKVITNGIQTNQFERDHHDVDTFVGAWINNDPLNVHRLSLHHQYTTDFFKAEPTTLPGTLPRNETFSAPILAWSLTQSDFIKETFADKVERVEDINLGHQPGVSVGYSARVFGATDNTVPFTAFDAFGIGNEGSFTLLNYGVGGRFNTYAPRQPGGQLENTIYFINGNYYYHLPVDFPFTAVAHAESAFVQNIDSQNQLQLGGDTGLRGFKSQSFTGNKSAMVNLEGRAYYPSEVFHLVYLGGAFFLDSGEVQPPGQPFKPGDVHASVGAGLRIGLTRSTEGTVYRVDVAYALGPIQQSNRFVVSITAGQGFQRSGNSYSKFPNVPAINQ